jgi:SAM-dependent methyltransferase
MNNKNKKLKVTFIDKLKLYSDIQRLKFKKIKRDYNEINKDYNNNSERWNRNLDEINFETWKGNYNVDGSVIRILSMNKKLIKGTWDDYAEKYTQQIIDSLIKYKTESVVELGSGLGFLLFKLNQNNFKKLEGFDLSENAISVLKKYCEKKNYLINFNTLDLVKPFPENIIKDKVVYTHTCLEQLKNYMPKVIKNIIDGKPKIVINFEVDYDSAPFLVKEYFKARDYQNNLVKELRKHEKQGTVKILSIEKLPLSLSPLNHVSVITWKIN